MPAAAPADPPCPCGLPRRYADCCGRWHLGGSHLKAPDAEALMRSRYSAWVLRLTGYLLDTWHPSTRPNASDLSVDPGVRWLGLDVRRHRVIDDDHAEVEFVVRRRDGSGRAARHHETSRFVRDAARWLYVDGDIH